MLVFKKISEKHVVVKDNETGNTKKLILKRFQNPTGVPESFFVEEAKDSVQIFAITTDNNVLLVKQYRPGNEQLNIELPGGSLAGNEELVEAAKRELREETGYKAGSVEFIASVPYSPYSTGIRHSFLATECRKVDGLDLDPNEFLTVHVVNMDTFKELARTAKVRGYDVALLGLLKLNLLP